MAKLKRLGVCGAAAFGTGAMLGVCRWCADRWGVWWQVTPVALTRAVTDADPAVARRAFEAMRHMGTVDVAAIEAACRG